MNQAAVEQRKRTPKGLPSIRVSNGRLQIHITYQRKTHYLSLGLPDAPKYRKRAEEIAGVIEKDLALGIFDTTLDRYREMTPLGVKENTAINEEVTDLLELWERFQQFRVGQIEQTTWEIQNQRVTGWLAKLPTNDAKDAIEIRDYLVMNASPTTAKDVIQFLNTASRWGVSSKLCSKNYFQGLASQIKQPKGEEDDINPFTREEMANIIQAFSEHPTWNHYTNFVRFLFLTGCRTSEAVGLEWGDISSDYTKITFNRAKVRTGGKVITKRLKTQERRTFPCNAQLQALLEEIKPLVTSANDPVFKGVKGGIVNATTFTRDQWKGSDDKPGIATQLVERGLLERYETQYNTRHTFITLALQSGVDVATVARWVGNSPETIYKHYCGHDKSAVVPEF